MEIGTGKKNEPLAQKIIFLVISFLLAGFPYLPIQTNNRMRTILKQMGIFTILLVFAASCSRTPYASFGGGPKRLTAGPKKQYARVSDEKLPEAKVANAQMAEVQGVSSFYTPKAGTTTHLRKALRKLERTEANASVARLSTAEKLKVAREVYQIKKDIEKSEIVQETAKTSTSGTNQLLAAVLCFFLGYLGIHRFYLGYIWQGLVQLFTFGGCGIWALIDLIRILIGDLKPKGGSYVETLDSLDF